MKDLIGLLNQLSLDTLTFQLTNHFQEVPMRNCKIKKSNKRTNQNKK